MSQRLCGLPALTGAAVLLLGSSMLSAGPVTPVYFTSWQDSVTGTRQVTDSGGKQRWTIEAGADRYQNDVYERPTAQEYKVYSTPDGQVYAAKEYFAYLDIVQAKAGFDDRFMYVSIEMFGRHKHTEDNTKTTVGLVERYGFRMGADGPRNSVLLVADQPELKNHPNTTFASVGTLGYRDTNGDVGGAGGINVTKQDGDIVGDGFDQNFIGDGKLKFGVNTGTTVMWVRIDPNNPNAVEFAIDYSLIGFTAAQLSNLGYLDFEAIKGGPKDPQNYLWNDKYNKSEAGSPYVGSGGFSEFGTQGLGNLYELDTLRGGAIIIPTPGAAAGGLVLLAAGFLRRTRAALI